MRRIHLQSAVRVMLVALIAGGLALVARSANAQQAGTPGSAQVPPPSKGTAGAPTTANSGPVQKPQIPPPANPAAVLYDQMDQPAPVPGGVTSQDFEASFDQYDSFAAD